MTALGQYRGVLRDDLGYLNTAGRPATAFYRSNLSRVGLSDTAAPSTGVMVSMPIWLEAGDTVTNLTFISGGTAGATLTHWWFALYSSASTPALLAQTADQTSTAWAADTVKTLALATAQDISDAGVYWAAVSVTASTVPSLIGAVAAKPVLTGEGNLGQTSGTSLGATAPATIASPAFSRTVPLVVVT